MSDLVKCEECGEFTHGQPDGAKFCDKHRPATKPRKPKKDPEERIP